VKNLKEEYLQVKNLGVNLSSGVKIIGVDSSSDYCTLELVNEYNT
jgi:hypothetical protein